MIISLIFLSLISHADESTPGSSCMQAHEKAISVCAAHEQTVSPDALTIVSVETRGRVVASETNKLNGIRNSCRKQQEVCALACDEAVETATLGGEDMTTPLDFLSDCRQGKVVKQLQAMNKKMELLKKIQNIGPAKRRAITSADAR